MKKDLKAIVMSLLLLAIGFIAIWFTKARMNIDDKTIFVSVLFIPVLVYVILSGRLKEFKGPGGIEAKFAEAAKESISPASEKIEPSIDEMQIVVKEGIRALQEKKQELDEGKPIIMTMTLGKSDYYRRNAVLEYIEVLSQFRNFKFVVFIDDNNRFVAYMPAWSLKGLLSKEQLGREFIDIVNGGRSQALFSFPGVVRETISTKSTNAQALQEMTKQNTEALVVIDENRNLKGVIEREQVLSKMMLVLTT
jgi:hypothetical protein